MSIEDTETLEGPDNAATATDEPVEDNAEETEVVPKVTYDVTSYGSDPDVEGLVRKLDKGDIYVPPFQRDYVWKLPEASRFIESLLLGLPVPGVFFATDTETNKQMVIDGQQRLKSLQFYYKGYFNPKPDDKKQRIFRLTKVQPQFEGKTYEELDEPDRVRLDNSIVHATIVKQTAPAGDDTSLYHIFERLNSGGRRLTAQEIRIAVYHGPFIDKLRALNQTPSWRDIFGGTHSRLKDEELILRFFAMLVDRSTYSRPMAEFLNKFASKNRTLSSENIVELSSIFVRCCQLFYAALEREAFRPTRALNAAVFDSCMVGLAERIKDNTEVNLNELRSAYRGLLQDREYLEMVSRSTADEGFVEKRMAKSIEAFGELN